MAYKRGRTIASWGQLFGPFLVDSGSAPVAGAEITFGAGNGTQVPVVWAEIDYRGPFGTVETKYVSNVHVPCRGTYYGGYKDAAVLSFGELYHGASDDDGQHQSVTGTLVMKESGFFALLANGYTIEGSEIRFRAATWADIQAGNTPMFLGRVKSRAANPRPNDQISIEYEDYQSSVFDSFIDTDLPRRTSTEKMFRKTTTTEPILPEFNGYREPVYYGVLTTEYDEEPHGAVLCYPAGSEQLSGGIGWCTRIIVQAGAAGGIRMTAGLPRIYSGGRLIGNAYLTSNQVVWPGGAKWDAAFGAGAPHYRDYTDADGVTRRYYCFFVQEDTPFSNGAIGGAAPLTVDFDGCEDVGDGTGTRIDNIHKQMEHYYVNFIIQEYETGNWLTAPMFADGATSVIDTASFDLTKTITDTWITGGIVGAWGIGVRNTTMKFREWLEMMHLSGACATFHNVYGQFACVPRLMTTQQIASLEPTVATISQVWDVSADSIAIERDRDRFGTSMEWNAGPNLVSDEGWLAEKAKLDDTTLGGPTFYGREIPAKPRVYRALRHVRIPKPLTAPTLALAGAGAGNVTAGNHRMIVRYKDALGNVTGFSPQSLSLNVTNPAANGKVNATAIPVSPDPLTAERDIGWSKAASPTGPFYFLATIADNTTTTLLVNTADGSLGAELEDVDTTNNVARRVAYQELNRFAVSARMLGWTMGLTGLVHHPYNIVQLLHDYVYGGSGYVQIRDRRFNPDTLAVSFYGRELMSGSGGLFDPVYTAGADSRPPHVGEGTDDPVSTGIIVQQGGGLPDAVGGWTTPGGAFVPVKGYERLKLAGNRYETREPSFRVWSQVRNGTGDVEWRIRNVTDSVTIATGSPHNGTVAVEERVSVRGLLASGEAEYQLQVRDVNGTDDCNAWMRFEATDRED